MLCYKTKLCDYNNIKVDTIIYLRKKIVGWGKENYAKYPWRCTNNDWHILVAEIMLQRTNADQVVPIYNIFCKKYPTPKSYFLDRDIRAFDKLGLKWREENLYKLAITLGSSSIPINKDSLMNLPGIGNYIASAYRSLYKGERDILIDSNIVRLYGRFFNFYTNSETRRNKNLFELANRLTPKKAYRDYNFGLIDFTREICRPRPNCDICNLGQRCLDNIGTI